MTSERTARLKEKAAEELRLLLWITAYLAAFFAAFLTYRRLISREFGVTVFHYGYALLEAVLIAKVILIGKAMGLGRSGKRRALAVSVLRASLVYGALVAAFEVIERVGEGLFHHKTLVESLEALTERGFEDVLARAIVIFVAFIPFFAFWELGRLVGNKRLDDLFFRKGAAEEASVKEGER